MAYDANTQSWTAAQLLDDVRRKASLPYTSASFPDTVLFREAVDVLWNFAGWALSQAGEGRLARTLERTVTSTLDALNSPYRAGGEFSLPALAIADTIDNVSWLDSTGQTQASLMRIDAAEESSYDTPGRTGDPAGYALIDGRIRIYPQPTTGGKLRITYQRRHGELIPDSTAGVWTVLASTAVGTTEVSLTLNSAPGGGIAVNDNVDLIVPTYPYRYVGTDLNVTQVSGTSVRVAIPATYLTGFPTGLRVMKSGWTPYVHYPLELRAAVTEKVAANIMRILGDVQGMQAAELAAKEELSRVIQMLSPRAKRDKPKAINPHSHMRGGIIRGRRW